MFFGRAVEARVRNGRGARERERDREKGKGRSKSYGAARTSSSIRATKNASVTHGSGS